LPFTVDPEEGVRIDSAEGAGVVAEDGTDATVAGSSSPQAVSSPRATTAAAQERIDRDGIVFIGLLVSW
jgi:hypothetical protein